MPTIEELKSLVSEFRSQGVSEEEIRQTLVEMNVDKGIIEQLLGSSSGDTQTDHVEEPQEEDSNATSEEPPVPPLPEEPPEEADQEVETLPVIQTEEKVEELHKKVEDLHKSVARSEHILEIKERLLEIEKDMKELKAQMKAVQKLLQEILNTERNILLDLYEKAKKR